MKQIYIATPVNGREGADIASKRIAACKRVQEIIRRLREVFDDDTRYVSSFDVAPLGQPYGSEAEVMGKCIALVLQSDMVVYDNGWSNSKGCRLETFAASLYGIECIEFSKIWNEEF